MREDQNTSGSQSMNSSRSATTGSTAGNESAGAMGGMQMPSMETLRGFGDKIATQYNSLSTTQKIVGASLLAAGAVGATLLTRNLMGGKNTWTGSATSQRRSSTAGGREVGNGRTSEGSGGAGNGRTSTRKASRG